MKKKSKFFVSFFLILALVLIGCGTNSLPSDTPNDMVASPHYVPSYYTVESFYDKKDLKEALTNPNSEGYARLRERLENQGKEYAKFLSDFESGKNKLALPLYEDEDENLETGSLYKFTVIAKDILDLPCVAFYDGIPIRIMYLSVLEDLGYNIETDDTYLDIHNKLTNSNNTPGNYNRSAYKYFYEETFELADGTKVAAWVYDIFWEDEKDDNYAYVCFRYQDLLVYQHVSETIYDAPAQKLQSFKNSAKHLRIVHEDELTELP